MYSPVYLSEEIRSNSIHYVEYHRSYDHWKSQTKSENFLFVDRIISNFDKSVVQMNWNVKIRQIRLNFNLRSKCFQSRWLF